MRLARISEFGDSLRIISRVHGLLHLACKLENVHGFKEMRMRNWLRRSAWLLGSLLAIYLVAGNIFLNSALGPWAINRKPEKFTLNWSYGVTWWPGQIALWNVQAKGHVRRIAWSADAAQARGRIALLPLFGKELRIPRLAVSDVSGSVNKVVEDILPPEYRPGGWTLRFDHIASDTLKSMSVMGASIEMQGNAVFAFSKQLRGGPLEIFPSELNLQKTSVRYGELDLLREASINARLSMPSHRSSEAKGLDRIALIDASLQMRAAPAGLSVDLDPAGHWRGAVAPVTDGQFSADLVLQDGQLQSGGNLHLRIPMSATRGAAATNDAASLQVTVDERDLHLVAQLPPPPEGSGSANIDLRIAGTSIVEHRELRSVIKALSGSVLVDWHFNSLDWLGPLLVKTPWISMRGAGRLSADLKLLNGRLQPESKVDIPEVQLTTDIAEHRFTGTAKAHGQLERSEKGVEARIELAVADFAASASEAPDKSLLSGKNFRLALTSNGDLDDFRDSLSTTVQFKNAQIPDLRAINTYLPGNSLNITAGAASIDGDLALDANGAVQRGRIGVRGKKIGARVGEISLSGDIDLDARVGGSNVAQRYFDLDNTQLRLRNIDVTDAGRTAGERWWATIKLNRGRLEATRPWHIDSKADIEMENVGLLLALFARHKDYPRWALKLVDAGKVQATGRVVMRDKSLLFDRVEARNNRFAIKARLNVANARAKGDLLLRWGILSLGLELDHADREFHFLRAADWYHARPDLLPN